EIESVFKEVSKLKDCSIQMRTGKTGEKFLVLYYISTVDHSVEFFKSAMQVFLPDFMIPAHFISLESFPINMHGKLDIKLLPDPEEIGRDAGQNYRAPQNLLEEKMVAFWELILDKRNIGTEDNFF